MPYNRSTAILLKRCGLLSSILVQSGVYMHETVHSISGTITDRHQCTKYTPLHTQSILSRHHIVAM